MGDPCPAFDLTFAASDAAGAAELRDLAAALLDGFDALGVEERGETWRIFFTARSERDRAQAALTAALGRRGIVARALDVPVDDWAVRNQADLRALRVGRIVIAPPWDAPPPTPDAVVIVIQPSTGFGTGHHASTRLCLEALQRLDLTGCSVLDVGTGSGVLALAAAALGARSVVALDVDPDALDAARDSLGRNPWGARIQLRAGDVAGMDLPISDVVLANLTGAALVRFAERLCRLTRPGGHVVAAGFLASEATPVSRAFRDRTEEPWRGEQAGWGALVCRTRS